MSDRPIIGVTGPMEGGFFAWAMTRFAVWRAGGRAVRITVANMNDFCAENPAGQGAGGISHFPDALVLGGGSDIMPEHYGEQLLETARSMTGPNRLRNRLRLYLHPGVILLYVLQFLLRTMFSITTRQPKQDAARDTMEMTLCRRALRDGIPTLGICRGSQMLNIALGGTLHQDTTSFYEESPKIHTTLPKKSIHITIGSRLHAILGTDLCRVNSLHDQAINTIGDGLKTTALEETGIVQGIEDTNAPFVIGVQWHPEYMPQSKMHQRIFQELVRVAARR